MHASDGWINTQAMFIHKDALHVVDPLSSKDHVVVVDFHRFIDCHLETIFDVNKRRDLSRDLFIVDGKNVRLTTGDSSLNPVQYNISPHRHSQLSDLTIRLYSSTSLKSISLKWWLYHQMFKLSYWSVQLCSSKSRDQSVFALIGQSPHSWRIPLLWP